LKISEQSLQTIIDHTPVGICITNGDGNYDFVNSAYCRLYGYEAEELVGNSFLMVVPEEGQEYLAKLHDDFLAGARELRGEWKVQTKDARNLYILAEAARIFGEDGKPRKVTFVIDVTKEKSTQERLELEVQRASSLEKVRDNVDSMIRHDLRNPLNGIMGSCQLLLEDQEVLPEDALELVKLVYASSQKLKGLLDTTVDLVSLEQGNFVLHLAPEEIPEIISVEVQELEFLAATLEVEVRFEAPFDWEPWEIHKTLFQSMVSNLLRNGIEASRPGESVIIELEKEYDGTVPGFTIHMHNKGVIPAELNAHIFGERVNSKKPGGSGIGTYLVGLAVRAHGGTIRYSSDQQRGTRIHVWIPNLAR